MYISKFWLLHMCLYTSHFTIDFVVTDTMHHGRDMKPPWTALPNNMVEVCPRTKVCRLDSVRKLKRETKYEPRKSCLCCCTECSCEITCGLTLNCCFRELDLYKLVDRSRQQCIYPQTAQIDYPWRWDRPYQAYYMITECPNTFNKNSPSELECGSQTTFPWGTLLPIYSKTTGRIYKNSKCAQCHGIKDGEFWKMTLSCKSPFIDNFLDNDLKSLDCEATFKLSSDLESEKCFNYLPNTCSSDFTVPQNLNMTKDEIKKACTSGLLSPFGLYMKYANIFCYICNGNKLDKLQCIGSTKSAPSVYSFIHIIDPRFMKTGFKSAAKEGKGHNVHWACSVKENIMDHSDCRRVHCPSGKIRVADKSCEFWSITTNIKVYELHLQLIPIPPIDMSSVHFTDDIFVSLKLNKWTIAGLSYEPEDAHGTLVKHFNVILRHNNTKIHYKRILNNIQASLKIPVTIYLNKTKIQLFQAYSKYNVFNQSWTEIHKNITHPDYKILKMWHPITFGTLLSVTKLMFCMQIELLSEDFVLYKESTLLFYKPKSTFMFPNEFLVRRDKNGFTSVRMCLSDTDFIMKGTINGKTSNPLVQMHATLLIVFGTYVFTTINILSE